MHSCGLYLARTRFAEAEQGDEDAELWNIPGEHKAGDSVCKAKCLEPLHFEIGSLVRLNWQTDSCEEVSESQQDCKDAELHSIPRREAEVCSIPDRDEAANEVVEADQYEEGGVMYYYLVKMRHVRTKLIWQIFYIDDI